MGKLTDQPELAEIPANGDWIHVVDISDTSSDPAGSSKKLSISNLLQGIVNVLLPADFNFNNFKGINLAAPTSDLDATNKAYVDNLVDGLKWKTCARAATTGDIVLSGLQTIDGVSLADGDRVLVWQQADPTQNGIYSAAAGAWSRTEDANTGQELVCASITAGSEGATLANTSFTQTTPAPITIGVSNIVFVDRASITDHNALAGIQGGAGS